MPYKSKEAQRRAIREAVRKHRKGITSKGITKQGITKNWYPPGVIPGVKTEDQKERFPNIPLPFGEAYYKALAEQRGEDVKYEVKPKVRGPAIVEALVEKREKLEKISQSLNRRHLGAEVRYGVDGPTFDVVSTLLELT